MKKQEKKLTPTEKKTPEALSDEEVSSVAGGVTVNPDMLNALLVSAIPFAPLVKLYGISDSSTDNKISLTCEYPVCQGGSCPNYQDCTLSKKAQTE